MKRCLKITSPSWIFESFCIKKSLLVSVCLSGSWNCSLLKLLPYHTCVFSLFHTGLHRIESIAYISISHITHAGTLRSCCNQGHRLCLPVLVKAREVTECIGSEIHKLFLLSLKLIYFGYWYKGYLTHRVTVRVTLDGSRVWSPLVGTTNIWSYKELLLRGCGSLSGNG